jgi:hypothetical protein
MPQPGIQPTPVTVDHTRFMDLKVRIGHLAEPVAIEIPDLGRSAQLVCKPKGLEEIEVSFEGVSERGQELKASFSVTRIKDGATASGDLTLEDGSQWAMGHRPTFRDPDDEECLVGQSEDIRIGQAIPPAIAEYLEGHPNARLAATLLRSVRRLGVQHAANAAAELKLAADRRTTANLSAHVDELEAKLDESLSSDAHPTP